MTNAVMTPKGDETKEENYCSGYNIDNDKYKVDDAKAANANNPSDDFDCQKISRCLHKME